jgi:hypothetical protein
MSDSVDGKWCFVRVCGRLAGFGPYAVFSLLKGVDDNLFLLVRVMID